MEHVAIMSVAIVSDIGFIQPVSQA
ncbi:hypothetical protein CRE_04706 [Caenorhabditis remanei]|uniref:Uncharacterized protein n=1 Tax=Caenorhabditis remanei TaxID=31234 RepID=E3LYU4_CAERE|nr:hypothetical protein CRE_04706 [Caenorhabditis remanei]